MDLSFSSSFNRNVEAVGWPSDVAALLVGVAARQGASPTALIQAAGLPAAPGPTLLTPVAGCFSVDMAEALIRWRGR